MSIATQQRLVEGQHLDQPTFHELYEAMPPGTRAELIDGVVSMPSPVSEKHDDLHLAVLVWLDRYAEHTPGVKPQGDATVILDGNNEPQPDATLRIRPESGGRTRTREGYVAGTPELVVEIAKSSRPIDLGPKLETYEHAGILEYVVVAIDPDEVIWHTLDNDRYAILAPGPDGLYRSRVFPGLWLDPVALFAGNRAGVREALELGLNTREHAALVARLEANRTNP